MATAGAALVLESAIAVTTSSTVTSIATIVNVVNAVSQVISLSDLESQSGSLLNFNDKTTGVVYAL